MQPPATNTVCVWAVGVCLVTATDFDCVTNSQLTYSVTDNSFSVQTLNNIGYIKTARYTLCSIYTATPDMTRQSCLSCLVCWCKLVHCSERVQTSIFLSATVLSCRKSNSHRRSGRETDKSVLSCLAWRCELAFTHVLPTTTATTTSTTNKLLLQKALLQTKRRAPVSYTRTGSHKVPQ